MYLINSVLLHYAASSLKQKSVLYTHTNTHTHTHTHVINRSTLTQRTIELEDWSVGKELGSQFCLT